MLCSITMTYAQSNGTNSSYSRYGLGLMTERSQGFNKGMGGVAMGMRNGQKVNTMNPASYSAIDSLSFIMDAGMGLTFGHFTQNGNAANAKNASLEYVNAGFRLAPGLGMAIGYRPYSCIGFNFTSENRFMGNTTSTKTYSGNGGLHELYAGVGWNPFADLSIGANVGFMWGEYCNFLSQSFSVSGDESNGFNTLHQEVSANIRSYKAEVGVQYPIKLSKEDVLTLGGMVNIGHRLNNNATLNRFVSNGDTVQCIAKNAFEIPFTYSAGFAYVHQNRLTIAADYTNERWAGCRLPVATTTDTDIIYTAQTNQYRNRQRYNAGVEYSTKPTGRRTYSERIKYRLGASYTTSNVYINGNDGPSEIAVTAGVGLPIKTNSKSMINIAAEWMQRRPSSKTLIKENYMMLHLGITFNENWFMKWKIN